MKAKRINLRPAAVVAACFVIILAAGLLLLPSETAEAATDGLTLCAKTIIPCLFPFFVLSSLVIELGYANSIGRFLNPAVSRIFKLSGVACSALIFGWIGGYPVGVQGCAALYEKKQITKHEAERLLTFCNTASPSFILGAVGVGIMGNLRDGLILFICHLAACLIIGFSGSLFRSKSVRLAVREGLQHTVPQRTSLSLALVRSVISSLNSVLKVCAFIVFFIIIIRLLLVSGILSYITASLHFLLGPLGVDAQAVKSAAIGAVEMTAGLFSLPLNLPYAVRMTVIALILGWGGLSVHFQSISFLVGTDLSVKPYFIGKLLHGLVSALLVFICTRFTGDAAPAFVDYAIITRVDIAKLLMFYVIMSAVMAATVALIMACACIMSKISGLWKRPNHSYKNKQ